MLLILAHLRDSYLVAVTCLTLAILIRTAAHLELHAVADCCVDFNLELTGIFASCLSIEGVDAIGHHESATHEDLIVTMSVDVAALLERLHLCDCYYFFHNVNI